MRPDIGVQTFRHPDVGAASASHASAFRHPNFPTKEGGAKQGGAKRSQMAKLDAGRQCTCTIHHATTTAITCITGAHNLLLACRGQGGKVLPTPQCPKLQQRRREGPANAPTSQAAAAALPKRRGCLATRHMLNARHLNLVLDSDLHRNSILFGSV